MPNRVLIVDANPDTVSTFVVLLEMSGFDAMGVNDAGQALVAVGVYRPDVVLTGIRLPGDGGERLAELLLAMPAPRPKVVVLSGEVGRVGFHARLAALGADDALAKPVEPDVLVARLRRLCG